MNNQKLAAPKETQLDRIEKKMNRILSLLENKEQSVSLDSASFVKEFDEMLTRTSQRYCRI